MADKRISQLIERVDIANNDVLPIVASGATTTNKVTISTIQSYMQGNLDVGVTSVGLVMPSAFSVSGSPVTTSGNITVSAAGTASQYIRGDGTLADFPTGGGGGASVSYYLNGSVSQGTIGGIAYREINKTPILGAGTDFNINANGYIASFVTDAGDPGLLEIPGGNWNFETYFSASSGGGTPTFYVELYKVSGSTATLIASNSSSPELIAFGTTINAYFSTLAVPQTSLLVTDRLAIRYYVSHSGRTITLHTEDNHLCQIITTFTTGLTALNGLTAQVQNFAVGTSGSDFNISSSGSIHTFNLPDASASNRGAVTTGSQIFGGVKTFADGVSLASAGGSNQVTRLVNIGTLHQGSATLNQIGFNGNNNIYFGKGLNNGGVIFWTNSAVRYYQLQDADGTLAFTSQIPTNPVGGTGTVNQIPKFSAISTLTNSNILDNGTEVSMQPRLFVTSSGEQFVFTPNLGGTSNRIETLGGLPLEITTDGSSIGLNVGGGSSQFSMTNTSAAFTIPVTSNGQAATSPAFIANNSTGASGTAQYYINFTAGTTTIARMLRGNGASGLVDNGLNIDNFSGFGIRLNQLGGSGGTFSVTGGAATFGGALNGTTASFTSSGGAVSISNAGDIFYNLTRGSSITNIGIDATGTFYNTNTNHRFLTNSGTLTALTISSTGAATFSSSVQSSSLIVAGSGYFPSKLITLGGAEFSRYNVNIGTTLVNGSQIALSFGTRSNNVDYDNTLNILNGNVGIGTASPSGGAGASDRTLSINAGSGGASFVTGMVGGTKYSTLFTSSSIVVLETNAEIPLAFNTNGSERMRITSGGVLQMSNNATTFSIGSISGQNRIQWDSTEFSFLNTANSYTAIGASAFNTRSDYRLKENVAPVQDALSKITSLKPCTFNFIAEPEKEVVGFIAHEVQEVFPQAISGEKDAVKIEEVEVSPAILDEEGNVITEAVIEEKETPIYQGIDHSKLVPLLVAAIQELKAEVEALKSQING